MFREQGAGSREIARDECCVRTSVRVLQQKKGELVVYRGKACGRGKARLQSPEERSDEGLWTLASRHVTPLVVEEIGTIWKVP